MAAAISFFAFLSVVPLALLALSVAGFVLNGLGQGEVSRVVDRLARQTPGLGPLLTRNLASLVSARTPAGALGLLGILWGGTGAIGAVRRALASVFRFDVPVNTLRLRLRSLGLFATLGPLALAATAAAGAATNIGAAPAPVRILVTIVGVAVAFLLDFGIAATVYRVFVPADVVSLREHWPGALLCGGGFVALQVLGSAYARHVVSRASLVYGTFAGVVGVLVILNLASRALLYGAELTAIRHEGAAR